MMDMNVSEKNGAKTAIAVLALVICLEPAKYIKVTDFISRFLGGSTEPKAAAILALYWRSDTFVPIKT